MSNCGFSIKFLISCCSQITNMSCYWIVRIPKCNKSFCNTTTFIIQIVFNIYIKVKLKYIAIGQFEEIEVTIYHLT